MSAEIQQSSFSNDSLKSKSRKRARKDRACDFCRRKKIRCDYDHAFPENSCNTCRSHEKTCTFNEAAKKRGPPKGYVGTLESRLKRMEQLLVNIASNGELPISKLKAIIQDDQADLDNMDQPDTSNHAELPDSTMHEKENPKDHYSYVGSSSGVYLLTRFFAKNMVKTEDNEFGRPLDGHEEDLMVVRDCDLDCPKKIDVVTMLNPNWKLPPKELADYLVKIYFEHKNCLLPIVDKDMFYEEYHKANPSPSIIPVILSICKTSCRLLDYTNDPFLKDRNVDSASLIADLDSQIHAFRSINFFDPKIETIQVLLLNALTSSEFSLDSKSWISVSTAARMAQDLGLHRANAQQGVSEKEKEANKRLWWSIYITDKWFSYVMDRPLAIIDYDCNVDLPLIDNSKSTQDFTMFIHFVKLSIIFGEIFRRIYTPKAKKNGYKTKAMEQTLWNLKKYLQEWFINIPNDYKITDKDLLDLKQNPNLFDDNSKKIREGGPLTICYYAVTILLHRQFIQLGPIDEGEMPCLANAMKVCTDSAKAAIDVACVVPTSAIAIIGWHFTSYSIFEATLFHIYNSTNLDPETSAMSKKYVDIGIHQCLSRFNTVNPTCLSLSVCLESLYTSLHEQEVADKLEKQIESVSQQGLSGTDWNSIYLSSSIFQ